MTRTNKSKSHRCDRVKTPDCRFCRKAIRQRLRADLDARPKAPVLDDGDPDKVDQNEVK